MATGATSELGTPVSGASGADARAATSSREDPAQRQEPRPPDLAQPPVTTQPTPAAVGTPVARNAGAITRGAAEPRVAPRRSNPFLANDPSQKARRLARALVSDLVAYHPQKREEGLRAGTLKELFRDEVRRSWEEYVEQVGPQLAEGTPYFQDALNDILAGGRRVF